MISLMDRLGLSHRKPRVVVEAPDPSPEQIAAREEVHMKIQEAVMDPDNGFGKAVSDNEREAMIARAEQRRDEGAADVRLTTDEVRSASDGRARPPEDAAVQAKGGRTQWTPRVARIGALRDIQTRAIAAPWMSVAIAVAAVALAVIGWIYLQTRSTALAKMPAVTATQIAPPAPPPPTRAELQALSDKYDDLARRYGELTERASRGLNPELFAQFAQRLDGVESLANALKQNGASAPAVVTTKIDEIKSDVEAVKGALLDLASNVDGRLAQARPATGGLQVAREPTYTPPRAAAAHRTAKRLSTASALPVERAPGDAATAGSTTGSPSRGFTLATSGDVSQLKTGDVLPTYGRINIVRRSDGGVLVDTENGRIFVRDK